jgi:hypothetical protein
VVCLQIGNAPTSKVADLLRVNILMLEAFSSEPAEALITRVRKVHADPGRFEITNRDLKFVHAALPYAAYDMDVEINDMEY